MTIFKHILFFVFIILLCTLKTSYSQPLIQWQKCFGGSKDDIAQQIQKTNDGSFVIGGTSNSSDGDIINPYSFLNNSNLGYNDYWIVKLDSIGNLKFKNSFGGSQDDDCFSIIQTIDNNYVLTGSTYSTDGDIKFQNGTYLNNNIWIVNYDEQCSGVDCYLNIIWQKRLGGSGFDWSYQIKQTQNGGYIINGTTNSNDGDVTGHHGIYENNDIWVINLNSTGNLNWQKSLGGSKDDFAFSIQQTSDKGYVLIGYTFSNDGDVINHFGSTLNEDCWVVKLDSSGNIKWQKSFGGSDRDWGESILQTTDGGYIISGITKSIDGDLTGRDTSNISWDTWIIKIDSIGNIEWQKLYGGSNSDVTYSMIETIDGDFILTGYSTSSNGDVLVNKGKRDIWILKLNSSGELIYSKTFGGSGSDEAYCIIETKKNEYIIAGYTDSNDGDIQGNHGLKDYLILKFTDDVSTNITNKTNEQTATIYPNPFNNETTLSLSNMDNYTLILTDIQGRQVKTFRNITGDRISIPSIGIESGLYYLSLINQTNEIVYKNKIVINK